LPIRPNRRAELAKTSYELIAERGMEGVSLRAVARRLGATTGLVSHHFADRAELTEAALDHAAAVIVTRVMKMPGTTDVFDVLAAVLPIDAVTIENWRFAFSVRTSAMFDPDLRRFDRMILEHWNSYLPGQLAGRVEGDLHDACRHLIALVDGIALQAVLNPLDWPADKQIHHLRLGYSALVTGARQ